MLELAHERQFAVSQLGTKSVGFEVEHRNRVRDALRLMDHRFTAHCLEEICHPCSPHGADLIDLRLQDRCFSPLPALDLSEPTLSVRSTTFSQMAVERPKRYSLPLQELMNAAPPPSSTLKRKASNDCAAESLADNEFKDVTHADNYFEVEDTQPIKYRRASYILAEGNRTRTHRGVRMRRARSATRHNTLERPCDAGSTREGRSTSAKPITKPYRDTELT